MYDPRSEWREFIAANRGEAIAKAASFFGASEDQLEVAELPTGEVYGLGARVAVVAALKDRRPPAPPRGGERGETGAIAGAIGSGGGTAVGIGGVTAAAAGVAPKADVVASGRCASGPPPRRSRVRRRRGSPAWGRCRAL